MTIDELLKRHSELMDVKDAVIQGKDDIIAIQKIQIEELKKAVAQLLPLAERIQKACEDGDTKCYDNEYDAKDATEYKEIVELSHQLLK